MISFIQSQFLLYFAISAVLFFPGWFLMLAVFPKSSALSTLERFILSVGLSLVIADFIAFAYSKLNIPISALSAIIGILIFCVVCFGIYKLRLKKCHPGRSEGSQDQNTRFFDKLRMTNIDNDTKNLFSFSRNQFILILLLVFLGLFIKTAYFTGSSAPTATDMGHHMYWTQWMIENNKLPDYEGMPDFIIGEHIAIAEIAMIGRISLFSAMPIVILFLINTFGILTVFILALRIFKNRDIAILVLLFLGVLFAVSSPQAKFISGGVIGNIMGNLLMPLAFYFYYRAMESIFSNPLLPLGGTKFLSLAIFSTFGLFYTHHLTAFIFLFVFLATIILYLAANFGNIKIILSGAAKIILTPAVIFTAALGLFFFFFVFTPTYVNPEAVDTAVGTPEKSTREGLTLTNLKLSVGEARMALGAIGLIILAVGYRRKNFGYAIVASWTIIIFIMSTRPDLLFIDLPSSRIGNYLSYPLAILSAFGLYSIFKPSQFKFFSAGKLAPEKLLSAAFLIIAAFAFSNGLRDSAEAFKKTPNFTPAIQTFDASKYLSSRVEKSDMVLKDHNYVTADAWIKLFFMRGYRYPLSRGLFRRYEDSTNPREMCTLYMISNPNSDGAKECYLQTGVDYVMVNPRYDAGQFENLKDFNKVYDNGGVATFYRN